LEVTNDPQAWENDFFAKVECTRAVRFKAINSVVKFTKTPGMVRGLAPELGQHTEEILLELDYGWEAIAELKKQNVVM